VAKAFSAKLRFSFDALSIQNLAEKVVLKGALTQLYTPKEQT
jgi:hypothetical protein